MPSEGGAAAGVPGAGGAVFAQRSVGGGPGARGAPQESAAGVGVAALLGAKRCSGSGAPGSSALQGSAAAGGLVVGGRAGAASGGVGGRGGTEAVAGGGPAGGAAGGRLGAQK